MSVSDVFRKDNRLLIKNINDLKSMFSYPIDVLDYTEPGLANGVGEARKIGMNYAISKYLKQPNDLIVSLDADCEVDLNYVSTLFQYDLKGSAFTLFFQHSLNSEAIVYYELYLRYLRWVHVLADSPFSHYSVGSCLGTNVKNYSKCGGMPPKSATEDFHFLNKLRKQGKIEYCTTTSVTPSSRLSERVTLGTGYFLSKSKPNFDHAFSKLVIPHPDDVEKLKKINLIQKETHQKRFLQDFDGLETLRFLRTLWTERNQQMTKPLFMEWANQLWKTDFKDPKDLLLHVRNMEKSTAFVDV